MAFIDWCKENLRKGLISQIIISVIAFFMAAIEGAVAFVMAFVFLVPVAKYGPPPSPTPIVKYGPPVTPTPDSPDLFGISLLSTEGIISLIVILASFLLYAWAIFGWVFWGGIWYLKKQDKSKKE